MPTYQIKAPDGNTYSIDGPAGASDDQVREQVLKQHPGADNAAAPPQAEPSRSTLTDVAVEGGKGLLRGAASFAGDVGEAVMGPFGPGKHFANLKADITGGERPKPDPTYGAQISQAAGIEPAPQTRAGKFASTTGEVVGNPASYLGPGSALVKGGAAVLSGVGSEAAGQAVEGTPLEAPARVAGGLLGAGGATVAAERNLSKLAAQLPEHEAIKNSASQIYDSLKQSDVRISPAGMDDLLGQIKTDLNQEGFRSWTGAPGAPIFQTVEELATSGGTINGVDAVRKVLGRYKADPANALAADRAIDAIDDFMMHVDPKYVVSGNPQQDAQALKYAQSLWATHKQLETIEEGSIRGQRRAGVSGSGANRINTARQEINKILSSDKKSRGMSPEAKEKMEEIVLGTWLTNKTRGLGKYAPTGPVSASTTIAAGFAGGGAAAATVATGGFLAKYLGEFLTQKQIRELEQLIKSESPMGAPVAKAIAPKIEEQKAIPAAAATRSALTSPLAPGGP